MVKSNKKWLSVSLGLLLGVSLAMPAFAGSASLYLSPPSGTYTVGSTFPIAVKVNSGGEDINATEGILIFNPTELSVVSISKNGSIFSLWTTEPTFSNSEGNIVFGGGTPKNFTGTAGTIITITFKAKASASAQVNFSSGSVLAADGKGTNILASLGNAQFRLGDAAPSIPEATTPSAVFGAPFAPQISSPTHPDPNKWYAKEDAKFTWLIPSDVTGVRLLVGKIPAAIPTVTYTPAISEKEVTNLGDGIWYFHVQLRNANGWGGVSHFRFQIDTELPAPFEIKFVDGKETTNPRPTVIFDTTDSLSGIEYYKVKIGEGDFFTLFSETVQSNPYTLPFQAPGKKTILVQAFDKAANYTTAAEEFVILPIETPVITDYPQTLLPGATLSIKGTAASEVKVKIYIQKDEKEVKIDEIKSDKEGKWSYIGTEPLENGIYKIWAEAINSLGAISNSSEKVTIQVVPPAFIRIGKLAIDYLTTIITLLVLIGVIITGILWILRKVKQTRKRVKKETTEAERALYQAFKVLREETKEQIAKLDGEPGLNEREKKIYNDLKKALKISEEFIGKEIKDIEQEIE